MTAPEYDVIVVGARCAGSVTAMLLARRGLRVLVLERATFPSDTASTHNIQWAGTELLDRWGVLQPLVDAGVPVMRRTRINFGGMVLFSDQIGMPEGRKVSPERPLLDTMLAEAAAAAGADVRFGVSVTGLTTDDTGAVTGVVARTADGAELRATARVTVGADGRQSIVAREAGASAIDECPLYSTGTYSYFDDLDYRCDEFSLFEGRLMFVFPTRERSACVGVVERIEHDARFRADPERAFFEGLVPDPDMAERVGRATRAQRWHLVTLTGAHLRHAGGPGWALVGDAAIHKDPLIGHGITDAFIGADLLGQAIAEGLGADLGAALERYDQRHAELLQPIYELTKFGATYDQPVDKLLSWLPEVGAAYAQEREMVLAGGPSL